MRSTRAPSGDHRQEQNRKYFIFKQAFILYFVVSGLLGFAFIRLAFEFVQNDDVCRELMIAIQFDNIRLSMAKALSAYSVDKDFHDDTVKLRLNRSEMLGENICAAKQGLLRNGLYTILLKSNNNNE